MLSSVFKFFGILYLLTSQSISSGRIYVIETELGKEYLGTAREHGQDTADMDDGDRPLKLKPNGIKHIKTHEVVNLKTDLHGTGREHGQDFSDKEEEDDNNNGIKNIKAREVVNLRNDMLGTAQEHGEDLADKEDEEANKKGSLGN